MVDMMNAELERIELNQVQIYPRLSSEGKTGGIYANLRY